MDFPSKLSSFFIDFPSNTPASAGSEHIGGLGKGLQARVFDSLRPMGATSWLGARAVNLRDLLYMI